MKYKAIWGLVFLLVSAVQAPSFAQSVSSDKDFSIGNVGLIDLPFVLRAASASTKVRELLDEKRAEFSEEFQVKEAELLQMERELNLKRSILSEADFNAEVQKFQAQVADTQQEIQFKRRSLDQAFQAAQDQLREVALEIVTEIATREKLDLILNREAALIFRPDLNITEEVLNELNERTKNARIEVGELPF